MLVIQPLALVPMLTVWFLCLIITGWVGLSTMLAAIAAVPALLWLESPFAEVVFGVVMALFIIFTHRKNIRAMLEGKEYSFQRIRLRNWLRRG
jgi:glycerol-3-phosphate acyltransferase PlsY